MFVLLISKIIIKSDTDIPLKYFFPLREQKTSAIFGEKPGRFLSFYLCNNSLQNEMLKMLLS